MTPASNDGSEWSGINQYQSQGISEPASPNPTPRGALATPPSSGGPPINPLELNAPDSSGPGPRPLQNPSPPNSVTSRSRISDGTLSDESSRRYRRMEEVLSQHYAVLKRFLQQHSRDETQNARSNRARDKLLRLSAVQFLELSTDVYDELLRRQAASAGGRPGPPRPDVPPHLLPRPEFHEKRNHARQKLSSLQHQRFKDLATDVYCELERRFPHFQNPDRRGSATPSVRGRYPSGSSGYGPRPESNGQYGYPPNGFPPRSQSRGPPGPGGRGYPPGPPPGRFPPRQGSLGAIPGVSPAGLGINGEAIPENAPYQKSFQSNTIVPNKSTLVEDDDDGSGLEEDGDRRSDAFALDKVLQSRRETTTTLGSDREKKLTDAQLQVSSLEARVVELELELKKKDEEIDAVRLNNEARSNALHADRLEWEEMKADLTSKLASAQELNISLQNELDSVRQQQESMERELQQHIEQTQHNDLDGGEWKARFEELSSKHDALKLELQNQHEVTEQVRQEASNFLQEMKVLSEQTGARWDREENYLREIQRLKEEVKHWKNRYERSKTQLRHLRSSSFGLPGHNQDAGVLTKQNELTHPDGLIKDIHITRFQTSIDELLRSARSDEPSHVLEQMKSVVIAVRHIIQDIESNQAHGKEETFRLPTRAKTRVSATANNLITASKNFANSNGLSPVSLLDAAASHLTAAVIELVRHAKIRPTLEDELAQADDEDYETSMQSPGYFSVAPSQSRMSLNESIYSAISSPSSLRSMVQTNPRLAAARSTMQNGQGFGSKHAYEVREGNKALEELRLFLETQTEGLVESIQALVSSIRAEADFQTVRSHIDAIFDVVGKVITSAETTISQPDAAPALRERVGPIVQLLENCRDKLADTGSEGHGLTNPAEIREVTGKLPPIAFQIAKETKELVQRVDQLQYESHQEDDFH
ncbi:hypothetical protein VTO42DRAFT_4467 [Malbranchea cinnamomea]